MTEKKLIEIVVKKREDDYHAYIVGDSEFYGDGRSYFAAIGNLVASHSDRFGVSIEGGKKSSSESKKKKDGGWGINVPNTGTGSTLPKPLRF